MMMMMMMMMMMIRPSTDPPQELQTVEVLDFTKIGTEDERKMLQMLSEAVGRAAACRLTSAPRLLTTRPKTEKEVHLLLNLVDFSEFFRMW